ncbi:hypothetical protein Thermo_01717 [Thermoplasmatales archaeon]|nr:hypothetical protein Thermo_01717 [Thermoplasmatales archaeon]
MNIKNYGLREKYEELSRFGDRLAEMEKLVDWEAFRTMLADLYNNNTELGGRPNNDPVLMVKIRFFQSLYNLVDEAVEKEIQDRISFMNFLNYPDRVPDSRTIWLFRERLSLTGKDKKIWSMIWRQFESRSITVKKGMVHVVDPDHSYGTRKDIRPKKDGSRGRRRPLRLRSFFGYDGYVLDNTLSAPERDIFYNLKEFGFLEPHREELNIFRGRT